MIVNQCTRRGHVAAGDWGKHTYFWDNEGPWLGCHIVNGGGDEMEVEPSDRWKMMRDHWRERVFGLDHTVGVFLRKCSKEAFQRYILRSNLIRGLKDRPK